MTTLQLLQFSAAVAAIALAGIAVFVARRVVAPSDVSRFSALDAPSRAADDAADLLAAEDDAIVGVPFTCLGVEVDPPSAPDWAAHARASIKPKAVQRKPAPLALADVDRATSILREHVRDENASIAPWLMLLELYRTHGREQALCDLAIEFSERFHSRRDGAQALRGGADGGLEAFPPVMRLVTMLWGTHECADLLTRLARDRSEGRRLGLSRAAYVDLATLAQLNDTLLAAIDADRAEDEKVRRAWKTATYVAQARAA